MSERASIAAEIERQARVIELLRRRVADLSQGRPESASIVVSARGVLPARRLGSDPVLPEDPVRLRALDELPRHDIWPSRPRTPPLVPRGPREAASATVAPVVATVAFSLCGLARAAVVERIAEIAARIRDEPGLRPLVLLDDAEQLDLVRRQGWAVELVAHDTARLARRIGGIASQWAVARFVDLGRRPLPWPTPVASPGTTPTRLVFFKDYRHLNPYQRDLYANLPGIAARPGSIDDALALQDASRERTTLFHLSWEEAIWRDARDEDEARSAVETFLARLDRFYGLGGRLVWTLHNVVPHEDRFPRLTAAFQRSLAERADLVHVHGRHAASFARSNGIGAERLVLAPHGNYLGGPTGRLARKPDRVRPRRNGSFRFGFVGAMRDYKGVDLLIGSFDALGDGRARLSIVGAGPLPQVATSEATRSRIEHVDRRLGDAELARAIRRCDAVVLPYRRVTTSGTAMLVLGLGVPLILPALGDVGELVVDGESGFRFRAGDVAALTAVMRRVMALPRARLGQIGAAARAVAEAHDWAWIGRRLAGRMREVAERGEAGGSTTTTPSRDARAP